MLWTSDVVKDPWFPLVKDPSGSMSSYHLSRFTRRIRQIHADWHDINLLTFKTFKTPFISYNRHRAAADRPRGRRLLTSPNRKR